jgi:hypothetical protein
MSGDPMGKQHNSEPITDSDKVMSKRHKEHRKEIDHMKDGPEKLRKSMVYNALHQREHQKAMVDAKDRLKAFKKDRKSSAKMHK